MFFRKKHLDSEQQIGYTYLNYIGVIFIVTGVSITLPSIFAWLYDEVSEVFVFLIVGAIVGAIGSVLYLRKGKEYEFNISRAMRFSAIMWILVPLVGAIPFLIITKMSFVDAYFEAMSGFTATGLTMFTNIENLPRSILFWRSLIEWIGGVGVIVLMLAIIARPGMVATRLYTAEARTGKFYPTVRGTVSWIWRIYVLYTAIGAVLLYLAGMPLFDALNHSMTAIATGGFSVKNTSIGVYGSYSIEAVMIFIMLLGMISFTVHYQVLHGNIREFFRNVEVKTMFIFITAFSIIIFFILFFKTSIPYSIGIRQSIFQCVSALSGTGFSTTNISGWNDSTKALLVVLMVIGGGYGSTSSALKLIRVAVIIASLRWIVRKLLSPRDAVIPLKLGGKIYDEPEIMEATLYSLLYIIFLITGTILMTGLGFRFMDSLFEVASAQGNVGLSVGVVSPNLHFIGKIILIIEMWVGRLELIPAIILFQSIFNRK